VAEARLHDARSGCPGAQREPRTTGRCPDDISHPSICLAFCYLSSPADGYSRYILPQQMRTPMEQTGVVLVVHMARGKHARHSTNNLGPQFVANDFKELVSTWGISHVMARAR